MQRNSTLWLPYTQMQTTIPALDVVATNSSKIYLANGQTLIDGIASWWTAAHGYNHPHIIEAISKQLQIMPHIMLGGLVHEQALRLSERLAKFLGHDLNHVFFCESGSVSVEIAIKMALQYWINKKQKRNKIVYFNNGYHGDTFLTMSISDEGWMHELLRSYMPKQFLQPIPEGESQIQAFEQFLKNNASNIAALIIEPLIQGAGGMKCHTPQTLKIIYDLCKQYEILVIFDEIFTGFGRTGTHFAFEQACAPDIICLSKALTGGTLPLAATVTKSHIYNAFLSDSTLSALMHGTTFMGNAMACAAANASLDLFENEPRLTQVADIEGILRSELTPLQEVPGVKEVRIKGAMGAIQLKPFESDELNWLKEKFIEDGVWIRPFHDIIYTTPALTINFEDLTQITQSICKNVKRWSQRYI